MSITRRDLTIALIVFFGSIATFCDKVLPGFRPEDKAKVVTEASPEPSKPVGTTEILDGRQHTGKLVVQVGDKTLVLERYSRINSKGEEWDTVGYLNAGQFEQGHWWVEFHDKDHQFPRMAQYPATATDDPPSLPHELGHVIP